MGGFLGILKTVGSALLGAEKIADPVLRIVLPGSAPILDIFGRVQSAITTIEANAPMADGKLKQEAVVADFQAGMAATQTALALTGKKLIWDESKLKFAIDTQVSAYNAFDEVRKSFQVVDLSKTK